MSEARKIQTHPLTRIAMSKSSSASTESSSSDATAIAQTGKAPLRLGPVPAEPIGLHTAYCHSENTILDLKPKALSWSGLDINVEVATSPEAGEKSPLKAEQNGLPFTVRGQNLCSAKIINANGQVLFTLSQKCASLKSTYFVRDANKNIVMHVSASKRLKFDLDISFANHATGTEQRRLHLMTGAYKTTSYLYEGDGILAVIERPKKHTKMWAFNEPFRLTVSANVDTSMVLAIAVCMHAQLICYKAATLNVGALAGTAVTSVA